MVEQTAVNRSVLGSSPSCGASSISHTQKLKQNHYFNWINPVLLSLFILISTYSILNNY